MKVSTQEKLSKMLFLGNFRKELLEFIRKYQSSIFWPEYKRNEAVGSLWKSINEVEKLLEEELS